MPLLLGTTLSSLNCFLLVLYGESGDKLLKLFMQNSSKIVGISTATTTTIGTGTVFVHTIDFPKATAGTVTLTDTAGSTLFVYPAGSIGCKILDGTFGGDGLKCVTASADSVVFAVEQ